MFFFEGDKLKDLKDKEKDKEFDPRRVGTSIRFLEGGGAVEGEPLASECSPIHTRNTRPGKHTENYGKSPCY